MLLGPIISRLFTCSNEEKKIKKTKGACSSPISMVATEKMAPDINVANFFVGCKNAAIPVISMRDRFFFFLDKLI